MIHQIKWQIRGISHTCTYHDNRDVNKTIIEEYLRKYK